MPPKKFGLIKMQGFAMGAKKGAPVKAKAAPTLKKPALFSNVCDGEESDEDEKEMRALRGGSSAGIDVKGVNKSILQLQQHTNKGLEKLKAEALSEDPTAFQYDEVYDDFTADKGDKAEQRMRDFDPSHGRVKKESRYIEQLKKSAEIRKVDDERIFQMKLKKEADAEAHIYGDKEKFVTSAYREKLEEMGRWKAEDSRLEAAEAATTIDGKTSMTGFYANLLTKNLAMGTGNIEKHATSAYTVGSKRNEHIRDLEKKQRDDWDGKKRGEEDGAGDSDDFDIEELLQKTKESERKRARTDDAKQAAGEPELATVPKIVPVSKVEAKSTAPVPRADANASEETENKAVDKGAAAEQKKRDKEAALAAARERFLSRKKKS